MQPNRIHALQTEIYELRLAVVDRKNEKAVLEEAMQQLTQNVSNYRDQIDALTRNTAAEANGYQLSIDGLRTTLSDKDEALRLLYEKVDSDTNLIEAYKRDRYEAAENIITLLSTIDELNDDKAVLSQHVRERDARDVERERIERECIDYIYQNDGIEVCDTLLGDIIRARDSLTPQVAILHQVVGSVMWVSATWDTQLNTDDNDAPPGPPITLCIELDPIGYTTSTLPPTFKFTQGSKEFPVGHRIHHMMRLYMERCWGRVGFTPPPATLTLATVHPQQPATTSYLFDTDPRCVVPFVVSEGALITHLVRYAMLRMKTYADFCVVCDRPIQQHNRGLVAICDRIQCDYSFHELGVGYTSVDVERTPGTAPGLKIRNASIHLPPSGNPPTILMLTHILGLLPPARNHAVVCSAGSKGYCAVKETLQNGVAGNTLLVESDDLRNVKSSTNECCLVYTVDHTEHKYADHISRTVEHVTLYSNCVCLPPSLLKNVGVVSIDLSGLRQVTKVRDSFLAGCTSLSSLNLRPLSQVTEIHELFLDGCSGLTTLDLSGLSQLVDIHDSFLAGCTGLSMLDLSPLTKVTEVQGFFLEGCTGLTTLSVSGLSQLTKVHRFFLTRCTGLTTLDLSGLSKVTEVHGSFLEGCTRLTELDLKPLSQITKVVESFLRGCNSLDIIDNPPLCSPPSTFTASTCSITGINQWIRLP